MSPCHAELVSASSRRSGGRILSNLIGGQTLNQVQGDKILKNLFTYSLTHLFTSKKAAFTLAEVLITLAIIGVVAAMTIPTLISDYQEKVTVTKMKKMYSTLTQAYSLYRVENGKPVVFSYDEQGAINAANVFKPYLKIAKDCGTASGDGCIYDGIYKLKNGNNVNGSYAENTYYYKLRLVDGASMWLRGSAEVESMLTIFYDVNGEADPNKWGHDLFEFRVYKSGGLLPVGLVPDGGDYLFDENCAPADSEGWGCAAWVIHKGNMDYLKCPDELTWSDNKCK